MKNNLFIKSMPEILINDQVKFLFKLLKYKARFVGGCVRDSILEKKFTDIDIATIFTPDEVIKILEANNVKVIPTGIDHGTVTAILENTQYEITTLRKDIDCDGRHAKIQYTKLWEEDAARRDFTINALYCDIDGKIYDYFNGYEDLQNGTIKFVGDAVKRCKEDRLRIFRFFRFFAYYSNGNFDEEALKACAQFKDKLDNLSGERIRDEIFKLLIAPNPIKSLEYMQELGILDNIFFKKLDFSRLENLIDIENLTNIKMDALLKLVSILQAKIYDNSKIKEITKKLKLSNKEKDRLINLYEKQHIINIKSPSQEQKFLIGDLGNNLFKDILILNWSMEKNLDNQYIYLEILNLANNWSEPIFPVNGNDIIKLGVTEGKKIGEILKEAKKKWQLSNYALSKADILKHIKMFLLR